MKKFEAMRSIAVIAMAAILLTAGMLVSCGDGAGGGSGDGDGGGGGGGGGGVGLTITNLAAHNGKYISGSGMVASETGQPECIAALNYSGTPPVYDGSTTLTGGSISGGKATLNVWKDNGGSWVPYTGTGTVSVTLLVRTTSSPSAPPSPTFSRTVAFTDGVGTTSLP